MLGVVHFGPKGVIFGPILVTIPLLCYELLFTFNEGRRNEARNRRSTSNPASNPNTRAVSPSVDLFARGQGFPLSPDASRGARANSVESMSFANSMNHSMHGGSVQFSAGAGVVNGSGKYIGTQLSTISSFSEAATEVPVVIGQLPNGQLIYAPPQDQNGFG